MRVAGQCFSLGGILAVFGAVLLVSFAVLVGILVAKVVRFFGLVSVRVCGVCKRGGFRVFFSFVGCGALLAFLVAFPNPSFKRDWLKPAP